MKKLSRKDKIFFIFMAITLAACIIALPVYMSPQWTHMTSSGLGKAVNGKYYYVKGGKGIYEYTPGGDSVLLMKSWSYKDTFDATEDGIYLKKGKKIYFYSFETRDESLFFDAGEYDCSHITFDIMTNGNINIVLYNKYETTARQRTLQGKTGQVISPVGEQKTMGDFYQDAALNFYVGDRHIKKKIMTNGFNVRYLTLEENGENILPENTMIESGPLVRSGDGLVFALYSGNYSEQTGLLLIKADGNDEIINIPYHYQYNIQGDYAFSISNYHYSEIQCIDIHSGESWVVNEKSSVLATNLTTDGDYIYTICYGDKKNHCCWEIIKDHAGRPVKAVLTTDKL